MFTLWFIYRHSDWVDSNDYGLHDIWFSCNGFMFWLILFLFSCGQCFLFGFQLCFLLRCYKVFMRCTFFVHSQIIVCLLDFFICLPLDNPYLVIQFYWQLYWATQYAYITLLQYYCIALYPYVIFVAFVCSCILLFLYKSL